MNAVIEEQTQEEVQEEIKKGLRMYEEAFAKKTVLELELANQKTMLIPPELREKLEVAEAEFAPKISAADSNVAKWKEYLQGLGKKLEKGTIRGTYFSVQHSTTPRSVSLAELDSVIAAMSKAEDPEVKAWAAALKGIIKEGEGIGKVLKGGK